MKKDTSIKFWSGISRILVPFVVCGLIGLLSWQWFVIGCLWWECSHRQPFNSHEIQIPPEYFPSGATYSSLFPDSESDGAKQREIQTIYWGEYNGSSALLRIARYPGAFRAKDRFTGDTHRLNDLLGIPLEQHNELLYQSDSADQLFVGCGKKLTPLGFRCAFVTRYDEDLITLNMTVDEEMTLKDFERIIIYLDTVAAHRLGH